MSGLLLTFGRCGLRGLVITHVSGREPCEGVRVQCMMFVVVVAGEGADVTYSPRP